MHTSKPTENPAKFTIETIEDAARYIYAHEPLQAEWWDQQHRWNVMTEKRLEKNEGRLTALERRVMWLVTLASVAGSILGQFLKLGLGGA